MTEFPDFSKVRMDKANPKWEQAKSRIESIYSKPYDPRSPFERDMQRIMHSQGYRRLKNKTQVFLLHIMITSAQELNMLRTLHLLLKRLLSS